MSEVMTEQVFGFEINQHYSVVITESSYSDGINQYSAIVIAEPLCLRDKTILFCIQNRPII